MPNPKNNWYVITGGPSTGKSTLLAELEKLGYTALPEAARVIIDQAIAQGKTLLEIRADEMKFQMDVLNYKVKTEGRHPKDLMTFFDRGMHDTLAYLRLQKLQIKKVVTDAMEQADYKKVFLLDPLAVYNKDYARTETREEALELNRLLGEAFAEYGMKPIAVPPLSVKERADFVLQHVS